MHVSWGQGQKERASQGDSSLSGEPDVVLDLTMLEIRTGAEIKNWPVNQLRPPRAPGVTLLT